jgi:hypothetical protein
MSRRSQLALIVAGCLFAGAVTVAFFVSNLSQQHLTGQLGNAALGVVLLGLVAVRVIWTLSAIMFIVQAFKVHWGWGVAMLFLLPLAAIAFCILHPRKAKFPVITWAFGMALFLLILLGISLTSP